jgi:hypothetical protein
MKTAIKALLIATAIAFSSQVAAQSYTVTITVKPQESKCKIISDIAGHIQAAKMKKMSAEDVKQAMMEKSVYTSMSERDEYENFIDAVYGMDFKSVAAAKAFSKKTCK